MEVIEDSDRGPSNMRYQAPCATQSSSSVGCRVISRFTANASRVTLKERPPHSHSIVAGGLPEMS
jgi:hypothetical protein